jgi:molybdenum cofactor biosynthesis enzyme MoaA
MEKEDSKIKGTSVDRSQLFVMLLEECNFSCYHCAWKDGRIESKPTTHPGYKLSFEQLRNCLTDAQKLQSVQKIHFSGGETTLWKDGNRDFVNLLIDVDHAGFEPSFITNGSSFTHYENCQKFFERYFSASSRALHISHSLDTFHSNFDSQKRRAKSLDNLIAIRESLPVGRRSLLDVEVNACISKDSSSLLPEDMVEYYRSQGIEIRFHPLRPLGKAKSISHLCPNADSDNPEELGAFYPFYQQYKDYMKDHPGCLSLWGGEYHLFGRKFAELGQLQKSLFDAEISLH